LDFAFGNLSIERVRKCPIADGDRIVCRRDAIMGCNGAAQQESGGNRANRGAGECSDRSARETRKTIQFLAVHVVQ
jgi:hypothetical protein